MTPPMVRPDPGRARSTPPAGTVLMIALLAVVPLAGCIGGLGGGGAGPGADATADGGTDDGSGPGSGVAAEGQTPEADEADSRPHVHDRWDGQTEKVLVDETYTTRTRTEVQPGDGLLSVARDVAFGPDEVHISFPEGHIVPPGTDRVVVEATWPEDPVPEAAREAYLVYRSAGDEEFEELDYQGTPAMWTIDTDVEMADDGHAEMSVWQLRLELRTEIHDALGHVPSTEGGLDVDVRVTAHRVNGSLPLEPPHPDWYADGSRIDLVSDGGTDQAADAWFYQVGTDGEAYPAAGYADGTDHPIVPPGTRTLVAEVTWSNEAPTGPALPVGPDVQWNNGRFYEWNDFEPTTSEEGRTLYVLPVTEDMTDGMYQGNSRWSFRWALFGQDTGVDEPVFGSDAHGPYVFDGEWSIQIAAYAVDDPPVG